VVGDHAVVDAVPPRSDALEPGADPATEHGDATGDVVTSTSVTDDHSGEPGSRGQDEKPAPPEQQPDQPTGRHGVTPTWLGGHSTATTRPLRSFWATGPKARESQELPRLSPITKTFPSGTTTGPKYTLSMRSGAAYSSRTARPFTKRRPSRSATRSPPTPTTRLTYSGPGPCSKATRSPRARGGS